jgi:hypothetical protein
MVGMFVAYEYRVEFRTFDSNIGKPVNYFPGGETCVDEKLCFSGLQEKRISLAATGKQTNTQAPSQIIPNCTVRGTQSLKLFFAHPERFTATATQSFASFLYRN